MLRIILIVVLILLLLGALPTWPYSAGWGYYPSGGLGLILLILLVLILVGRLRQRYTWQSSQSLEETQEPGLLFHFEKEQPRFLQ